MVQFYLPPDRWNASAGEVRLEGDEARHARGAFRLEAGDSIRLFDGRGAALSGKIAEAAAKSLRITVEREFPREPEPEVQVDLAQALMPGDTMDSIVRQATELGVRRIWPIACERSVVRLDAAKRSSRMDHWNKIALAACKQCDRNSLPEIMPIRSAGQLCEGFSEFQSVWIACPVDPEGEFSKTSLPTRGRILLAIGPEGDFSPEEIRAYKNRGGKIVSLGPLVLKSDTAAAAALSVINFLIRQA